jgi:hypothetical protein
METCSGMSYHLYKSIMKPAIALALYVRVCEENFLRVCSLFLTRTRVGVELWRV